VRYSASRCVAVCCSSPRSSRATAMTLRITQYYNPMCFSVVECVTVRRDVLQCVAAWACCSALQCVALCCSTSHSSRHRNDATYHAVFERSASLCVAVCCSVLTPECVAVYCSALQCVAVCRSASRSSRATLHSWTRPSDLLCYLQNDSFREFLFHLRKDFFHFVHTCSCVSWLIQTYDVPPSCVERFMSDMTYSCVLHDS